jgi:hypothetical protein
MREIATSFTGYFRELVYPAIPGLSVLQGLATVWCNLLHTGFREGIAHGTSVNSGGGIGFKRKIW